MSTIANFWNGWFRMKNEVILGWAAPTIKEQFPELPDDVANHYDEDNKALMRLRMRGYVTDSQRNAIIKKLVKAIEFAVSKYCHPTGGSNGS